jgi:hypothetical protein
MVIVYWVVGNALQSVLGGLIERAGLVGPNDAVYAGLIVGWGLLFVLSLVYRDHLDRWLRT